MSQKSDFMRKIPLQRRAHQTMDEIFEATAQLLNTEVARDLNTNRVAERAGFSIGTLYSYFPNKASLLRALALRELRRHEARFNEQMTVAQDKDAASVARVLVRQAMAPFEGRHRVRQVLISIVGHDPDVQSAMHQTIDRMTERFLEVVGIAPKDVSQARRFVLLRAVLGPIRAAAIQAPEMLAQQEFEDELVNLILSLVGKSP